MHQATTSHAGPGVLASLRRRMPHRRLSLHEALRIAELQANVLLQLSGVDDAPVSLEILTSLPRIRLAVEHDLPTSGSAHWSGSAWVIMLNADEPATRLRYSAFHELKHIVDSPVEDLVYRDDGYLSAGAQRERVADYFSACVLMSKRIVKRYWGQGIHKSDDLATLFDVSQQAMQIRLDQLGLTTTTRCERPDSYRRHRPKIATLSQFHNERALA